MDESNALNVENGDWKGEMNKSIESHRKSIASLKSQKRELDEEIKKHQSVISDYLFKRGNNKTRRKYIRGFKFYALEERILWVNGDESWEFVASVSVWHHTALEECVKLIKRMELDEKLKKGRLRIASYSCIRTSDRAIIKLHPSDLDVGFVNGMPTMRLEDAYKKGWVDARNNPDVVGTDTDWKYPKES